MLLERDGTLQKIFDRSATSGFGELTTGAIILIGVAIVAAIAGICVMARSWMDLRQTDRWIQERCRLNPDKCDETLEKAIDNMFEGRSPGGGGGGGGVEAGAALGSQIGMYLGIGLLAYIGFAFVLPAARDAMTERNA